MNKPWNNRESCSPDQHSHSNSLFPRITHLEDEEGEESGCWDENLTEDDLPLSWSVDTANTENE